MKRLYTAISAVVAALIMWACGPAEQGYTMEYELQGLYTVNKSRVEPEFSDTFLFMRNIDSFDLETGDRAFLLLHYYFDAYSGVAPQWDIRQVLKKVPIYPLSSMDDVNAKEYSSPIIGFQPVNFFNEYEARTWVWKDKQNINIKYKGVEEDASFALAVRGVKDSCVVLELFVNAKESDELATTLLTFDISNIKDFLSDDEKALLSDSIKTKIYYKRMNNGELKGDEFDGNHIVYF